MADKTGGPLFGPALLKDVFAASLQQPPSIPRSCTMAVHEERFVVVVLDWGTYWLLCRRTKIQPTRLPMNGGSGKSSHPLSSMVLRHGLIILELPLTRRPWTLPPTCSKSG